MFDLRRFSQVNKQRCEAKDGFDHPLDSWSINDWLTAVMGELGEAANYAKKLLREEQGMPGNKPEDSAEILSAKLVKELADTVIYLDLAFQRLGQDTSNVIMQVFDAKSKCLGYKGASAGSCQAVEYAADVPAKPQRSVESQYLEESVSCATPSTCQVVGCLMVGFGMSYRDAMSNSSVAAALASRFKLASLSDVQRNLTIRYARRCYTDYLNGAITGERCIFPMWPAFINRELILSTAPLGAIFYLSGDFYGT